MITAEQLAAIGERYARALDARPSKGPWTEAGVDAVCDSAGDVPELVAEIERLRGKSERECAHLIQEHLEVEPQFYAWVCSDCQAITDGLDGGA